MKLLTRFLLLLSLILGLTPCFCQVIDATICDSTSRFPITKYSYFLRTTELITIDSVVRSSGSFIKSKNEPVLVFKYDPYYYWFRIIVRNQQDKSRQLMLLMAPVGMYEGKLFQKNSGEWKNIAHAGLKYKFEDRSYQFTHHVFPFALAANSTDTLYLSIDASNVYKYLGFALIQPKELKIFENKIYFVFGIIEGLLLLFFVLNIALFFVLKEKLHLWYALYIAMLSLIVLKNDHLDQQFLGLDSEKAFRLTPYLAIGALAITVLMHVVQSFLKPALSQQKLLYRLSTILKLNVLSCALIHAFVFLMVYDYRIQSIVFSWGKISILLGICMIIVNCFYSIRKGFKSALFPFSGSLVFMIGSLQRLFFPSTLSFLFPPTTFHIGIVLETLIITFGMVYQYYWIEKEQKRLMQLKLNDKEIEAQEKVIKAHEEVMEKVREEGEKIRNRISEEIHDNAGQILTLAKLNLTSIDFDDKQSIQEKVTDSAELVGNAIKDLRNIAKSQNTDYVSRSNLVNLIQNELDRVNKVGKHAATIIQEGEPYSIPEQHLFFRAFQEILSNAIKHSSASMISVKIFFKPECFEMEIKDNGVGFDSSAPKEGLGLQNIKNHILKAGACYEIKSNPHEGTKFFIRLTMEEKKVTS